MINHLDFGADADHSASRAIDKSGVPVLVIHGTADEVVNFERTSIISKRGEISNPNVAYIEKSEPSRDGHNTYFYSHDSQAYLNECAQAYEELSKRYAGDVPASETEAFLQGVDKRRANTADPELIDQIDSFLAAALGK